MQKHGAQRVDFSSQWTKHPVFRLPSILIMLALPLICEGCFASYTQSPVELAVIPPTARRTLVSQLPLSLNIQDDRKVAPRIIGKKAWVGPQLAGFDVVQTTRSLVEQTLHSMGFDVYNSAESSLVCDVVIERVWVEWPPGFAVTIVAETRFSVTLRDSQSRLIWKRICRGDVSRPTLYGGGDVPTEAVQQILSQSMHKALQELAQEELVAAVEKQSLPPGITPHRPSSQLGAIAQRWAVVIGVADYKNANKQLPSLKYANRDAEQFATFLKSKAGGGFSADRVKLLTDKQATTRNIRGALFDFLKKTVKEDLVVIFFAGHGIPDPDKPSNLYLVAHDSDPTQIASTGFPMWDLDTALKRTIAAERVVVLVDACHSAGATEGIRGVKIGDSFNKYFDQLAKVKPGRVVFTSCEGYEVSREAKKWGGGHGVFTWALLEGLKGKADVNKNGIVTLGEVLDYVDITVRRETANEQHPTKAGVKFDRSLPMGVVK